MLLSWNVYHSSCCVCALMQPYHCTVLIALQETHLNSDILKCLMSWSKDRWIVRGNCCSFHGHIPSPVSAFLQKSLSLGSSPIWHSQPQPQEPVANPGPGATSVTSTPMKVDSIRTDYHLGGTTGHPTIVINLTMPTSVQETPEPPLPSAPPRLPPPRPPPPHTVPAVAIETPTAMEP